MEEKKCCSFWRCGHRVGLFLVMLFALCFLWYFVRGVEQDFHLRSLRLAFLGFDGMNFSSFVFGVIQVYVWGYGAVGLWRLVSRHHKCETPK